MLQLSDWQSPLRFVSERYREGEDTNGRDHIHKGTGGGGSGPLGETRCCGWLTPGPAVSTMPKTSVRRCFLKLLTSSCRFDEERLERAWVLRVTVNCCKDFRKSAWQRRRLLWKPPEKQPCTCRSQGRVRCWRRYRPCRRSTGGPFTCAITRNTPWRRSRC